MPVLKWASSHARSCKEICDYLTKSERHLATDYLRCLEVDRHGRPWWQQMDELRHATLFDQPHQQGKELPVSYWHLKLSCDPRDAVSLAEMRDLACWFLETEFRCAQAVACYHDDNILHIPHAHLIINTPSLEKPAWAMPHGIPYQRIDRHLQREAARRGMHAFDSSHVSVTPELWFEDERRVRETGRYGKDIAEGTYRIKQDLQREQAGTSLKGDIRARMALALSVSRTEGEYLDACRSLGLVVRAARSRCYEGEYVFALASGGKEVCGARLGSDWSAAGIRRRMEEHLEAVPLERLETARSLLLHIVEPLEAPSGDPRTHIGLIGTRDGHDISVGALSGLVRVCEEHGSADAGVLKRLLAGPLTADEREACQAALGLVSALDLTAGESTGGGLQTTTYPVVHTPAPTRTDAHASLPRTPPRTHLREAEATRTRELER